MSIQQNFPAISPSLNLNFARSKTLDPRITFTRTSSATRVNGQGLIEVIPANSARFDHSYDPVSGTVKSLGLLVEEARTNLLVQSDEFNVEAWVKNASSITTNTIVAPDGTLTGDKAVEDVTNAQHNLTRTISGTTNTNPYSFSVFAKVGERTNVILRVLEGSPFTRAVICNFNLSAGTAGSVSESGGATGSSATIAAVGNGWYRCSLTTTLGGSATSILSQLFINSSGSYTGDGTSGIFLWGSQLEQGSFPTSYIPTTASTVTRTADNVSMVGENFSSWYNSQEGGFYISSIVKDPQDGSGFFTLDNGSAAEYIRSNVGFSKLEFLVNKTSGIQAQIFSLQNININTPFKGIVSYKINDIALSLNGNSPIIDTSALLPDLPTRFRIGFGYYIKYLNGTISQLIYYPRRLNNTQLQTLSR